MADFDEVSFVIPGYKPETMPLARLIDYLQQIALVVDDSENLHLVGIQSSSVAPTFRVPLAAAENVREQARKVGRGEGTKVQKAAYNRLRRYVRRDSRDPDRPALLRSSDRVVLEVPPAPEDTGVIAGIRQASQVDGKLVRLGGDGDYGSIQLTDLTDRLLTGLVAKPSLIRELAPFIYQPIRAMGVGIWNRDEEGVWSISKMEVQSFEPLDDEPLSVVIDKMRRLEIGWPNNSIDKLLSERSFS